MALAIKDVVRYLEELCPQSYAEQWDNVGMQIGDGNTVVSNVLISLDITEAVVKEAIDNNANLIITHHPLIFKPLKNIVTSTYPGNIISNLIKNNIALYCLHTNLDKSPSGMNKIAAQYLDAKSYSTLVPMASKGLKKVVVFVPKGHEDRVREAIAQKGAGWIGNYSHCTFQSQGTGTFMPLDGTKPYIGTKGKLEQVEEYRLETIVEEERLKETIEAMLESHPYEEVAYDIYPLDNKGDAIGIGMVYNLAQEVTLKDYSRLIKEKFQSPYVKIVGAEDKKIIRAAFCSGSGKDFLKAAVSKGCDVYITGDIDHHAALDAMSMNIAIIDAGHHSTEKIMIRGLYDLLSEKFSNINFIKSSTDSQPFWMIKE